jgi:hypothetical protein
VIDDMMGGGERMDWRRMRWRNIETIGDEGMR